jgi:putative SOS response-associated peptidase YedK
MINARSESLADKPAFRDAFRKRRCLVPLDGFYEWTAAGTRRQGHVIRRRDRAPFALAGLWERWPDPPSGPKGAVPQVPPLESVTVVTTRANATLAPLHERMPVVLDPTDWDAWLDPATPLPVLQDRLRPAPDDWLDAVTVGPRVNSVRNDDPSCLDPPSDDQQSETPRRNVADDQPRLF